MESRVKERVREIVRELISQDLEEATSTGNIAGYLTPFAFKNTDGNDEDEEPSDEFVDYVIRASGYKKINENRWNELKSSDGTTNQKIGVGIRNVRKQLSEIEKFLSWYGRLKEGENIGYENYWKRTQKHINKIESRLGEIKKQISKLK